MKKALKIVLCILCVFTVLLGSLVLWQQENLQALYLAMSYNTEELAAQIQAQDAALKSEIAPYFSSGIREFTPEEQAQIESGEVTEKQMLAKVVAEAGAQPVTDEAQGSQPPVKTKEQKTEEIVSRYVSELYTLESEYIGKIEGVISSAITEYKTKRTGKNNRSLQLSIGAAYTGKLTALEGECDAKVSALLKQMEADLTAIGADTQIVSTIRSAYAGEKTAKRAYYLSKYGVN